ncbi:MAG: hypothetical protein OQK23_02510 [Rhodospirillales bacterium]|nr:hypothetical protein [Rhodospirillales bacterium]
MMEKTPQKKRKLPDLKLADVAKVFWACFVVLMICVPSLAVFLWARDGMWKWGAMPTHGVVYVVSFCAMALFLVVLRRYLRKWFDS